MLNIAQRRLSSQRLVGAGFTNPADVVRWLGAVQSQDYPAARWGLALRMQRTTADALDDAFNAGAFLRTHMLRPTWHFVAPEDLRWLLDLTSPRVHTTNAHMYRQMELDDVVMKRVRAVFSRALRDHHYHTRAELAQLLARKNISTAGPRLAYIMMHCELAGLICSGPLRGAKHTYALVDERVPPAPPKTRAEALAELAGRYFASHGPATVHDLAWWSGLTVRDAKLATELVSAHFEAVTLDGKAYRFHADSSAGKIRKPLVHLLPNYDEHVVAYRDHAPSLDPCAPAALAGWGNALTTHLVVRNGLVVGGWRRRFERDHVALRLQLLAPLTITEKKALARAIEDYGRFVGRPALSHEVKV